MALEITNTLTRRKEPFRPRTPGKVRMYVCGVTVYDHCHVGHGRAYVVFDVVYRWLSHRGYEVTYVRNFTDVDDKIIRRANERGVDSGAISEQFIATFHEDMDRLGVARPTIEPRATEHIPEMIALIERLIERGHAYVSGGDVYFSVPSYPDYGKLSKRNLEELRAGARVEPGEKKRDPADFALWKAAKPDEPKWASPWGEGRPGWHVECSAMSRRYLGDGFDIHGGGEDLIFPHHENEIAQSEASSGTALAHVWLHNAFVQMNAEKMSKSLGNVVRVRDMLDRFPGEVFRLFVLGAHYRKPIDFTEETMRQAQEGMERLYRALAEAAERTKPHPARTVRFGPPEGEEFDEALAFLKTMEPRFEAAMDDDFNTASAVSVLFEAARLVNRICARPALSSGGTRGEGELEILGRLASELRRLGDVLGLFAQEPSVWLEDLRNRGARESGLSPEEVEAKIEERHVARAARDFTKADGIRAWLKERGVLLEDRPDGSTDWRRA